MKKLLLVSCTAISVSCWSPIATAGDLGLAPASYDWSGGYVGVNAGAALNSGAFSSHYKYTGDDDPGPDTLALVDELGFSSSPDEVFFTAGVLAGYNWQMSSFVLGVEGDFNYLGMDGRLKHNVTGVMSQVLAPEDTTAYDKIKYESNWFGTVRGRLGYAMGNVMLYGTGGLAYGKLEVEQKLSAKNGTESAVWSGAADGWNLGWTLGGGFEYAVDRWVLGAEYLYVDLGSYEWGSSGNVTLDDPILQTDWSDVKERGSADLAFSVARATLKYRF